MHFILCFLENWVVHQKSEKQSPITLTEVNHKLLHGENQNKLNLWHPSKEC